MLTKYRTMDDQTLLNLIDNVRHKSPIIEELCTRIEARPKEFYNQPEQIVLDVDDNCPVCQARLISNFNVLTDEYTLIAK